MNSERCLPGAARVRTGAWNSSFTMRRRWLSGPGLCTRSSAPKLEVSLRRLAPILGGSCQRHRRRRLPDAAYYAVGHSAQQDRVSQAHPGGKPGREFPGNTCRTAIPSVRAERAEAIALGDDWRCSHWLFLAQMCSSATSQQGSFLRRQRDDEAPEWVGGDFCSGNDPRTC